METTSLLINAFAEHLMIPKDIINMIKLYYSYGFNINTFLLSTIKRRLCNITTPNLQYQLQWDHNFYLGQSNLKPQCIVNHTSLPLFIQNAKPDYYTNSLWYSNNWSLLFQTCSPSSLTAIHSNSFNNNCYIALDFPLPELHITASSLIYNPTNKTLYAMYLSVDSNIIYSLDCKQKLYPLKPGWIQWEPARNRLCYKREHSSLCLIDKDRFIAVIGGSMQSYPHYRLKTSKKVELFAVNCEVSVPLQDMNVAKAKGISRYNAKHHTIVTCGRARTDGMEIYDVNEDEWRMIVRELPFETLIEMFIDDNNANIVYFIGCSTNCAQPKGYRIDLRMNGNAGCKEIIGYDDNFQSFVGSACDLDNAVYDPSIYCLHL